VRNIFFTDVTTKHTTTLASVSQTSKINYTY